MAKGSSALNYIIFAIIIFMIAVTALFVYTSIHLKDRVIYRIVQQTETTSELLTRSAMDVMSDGHSGNKYEMILSSGNIIGVDYVGIFRLMGDEAFVKSKGNGPARVREILSIEKDTFLKSVENMSPTGFFDREENTYTRYVPLMAEGSCLRCHATAGEVLGVLKIRLSTEGDFELLKHMQRLIWLLGLIVCLPVGALFVAGIVIREKNRVYSQLKESNINLRRTYNELHDTQYYLQMILDNSRVFIVTTDTHGRIVEFNKEAESILGYSKEEVVGRDVLMLYENPAQRAELMNMGGRSIDGQVWEVRNRNVRLRSKSGKAYDVILTLSTMVNDKGKIIGTVGIGKDISEQKMLQHKILQSEKLAGIGTLASGIAHEINNPLAGILGMAEAIMDEDDLDLIKSHTKDIINYTVNARDIVRELSVYSRSAQNIAETAVDISLVIDNSLKMAKHSASFSGIEVAAELQKGCSVSANPVEMQQVFVNLIVNAIHAMEGAGTLSLRCGREGDFVRARVADTGHGIPEKLLTQIYDPFFTTKPVGIGTGLGLYVVYKIVTKYGGAIDVESGEGVGSAFTMRFPFAQVHDE